ncbi:hypothetical protein ACLOJK_008326 [Asimina triloba]
MADDQLYKNTLKQVMSNAEPNIVLQVYLVIIVSSGNYYADHRLFVFTVIIGHEDSQLFSEAFTTTTILKKCGAAAIIVKEELDNYEQNGNGWPQFNLPSGLFPSIDLTFIEDKNSGLATQALLNQAFNSANTQNQNGSTHANDTMKIYVPSNPRGAERLPPRIVAAESDFYLRRLWGKPSEDLTTKPKYLVTFTVGYAQKKNIDAAVKKFSENFTIVLFHYDGQTSEWDEFEWSQRAIHVSVTKQTKWWYAKRFLHPDIIAPYEYIFIWDEDLGVEHFDAEEYIKLVKKHGLEISQPGLEPNKGLTWQMTKRRGDKEVHKSNDLVHGWGLDFALRKCVEPAHEKIGVVDAQWIVHQVVPSLGNQGKAENGKAPWEGVRERCRKEWTIFQGRMANAEKAYFKEIGLPLPNFTAH